MSLHEAVLDIAKDMEENSSDEAWLIRGWAKQLRMVVKAAGLPLDAEAIGKAALKTFLESPVSPRIKDVSKETFDRIKAEEAQREKEIAEEVKKQEASGASMTECVNGGLHGTFVTIDPKMPVGAKTLFGSEVYWLNSDGRLHYSKEDTLKFLEERKKQRGLLT